MTTDDRSMSIGQLATRSGVAHETLRAWEKRYGLLRPGRTDGGHRRYGDADLARVLQVLRLRRSGLPTSLAAAQVLAAPPREDTPPPPATASRLDELRRRLWAASESLDGREIEAMLVSAARRVTTVDLLDEVLVPVLRRLGDQWRRAPRHVAQEHVTSTALRSWLVSRLRRVGDPAGAIAVVACPDGELHDLGAVMAALALAEAGWHPVVLGASTPWASAATVIAELRAPLVLIGATRRTAALRLLAEWEPPSSGIVIVGGPAVTEEDVADVARVVVHRGGYGRLAGIADAALR